MGIKKEPSPPTPPPPKEGEENKRYLSLPFEKEKDFL